MKKQKFLSLLLASTLVFSMGTSTVFASALSDGNMTSTSGGYIEDDSDLQEPIYKVVVPTDMVFALESAKVGMMDAELAAQIMYAGEKSEVQKEKAAEYAKLQGSAEAAAARGYIDNIILAPAVRKQLIYAFEMLYTKRENRPAKKHGTV